MKRRNNRNEQQQNRDSIKKDKTYFNQTIDPQQKEYTSPQEQEMDIRIVFSGN